MPRAVAVQARRELEYDHNVIVLAQQRLRDLQAVIEHHPRWWQFMSRRAAKDKLDQLAPHLPDWIRQYQTKFSLAKSALIEDIAAHDLALRTELKLKHEQYKKLDQSAQTAQSLLDASEIDQPISCL